VWIDSTKKDVTKYLYQGGVSTVLTGGVMLGGSAAPRSRAGATTSSPAVTTPRPNAAVAAAILKPQSNAAAAAPTPTAATAEEVPKYRAPIGSGRWGAPAHRFSAVTGKDAVGAGAGSWRRV
jgi:hypothetical protein